MIVAFIAGFLFAIIATQVKITSFDKIISFALLKDLSVAKILLFAISISSVIFYVEYLLGIATVSVKPFMVSGVIIGGLLFGLGIALLGYCPGTIPMAIGEGKIDAIVGYIGGIFAGFLFTLIYPYILPYLGHNFGAINLYFDSKILTAIEVLLFAALLFIAAVKIDKLKIN